MKSRIVLFALAASILAGCGGSGTNPVNTNPPNENAFAGAYESTLTLDEGKQGRLNLTVETDGDATGTLVVTAGNQALTRDPFSFTVGNITVNGTVNTDGTFELEGNDPNGGLFDITGNLPPDGNGQGSITVNAAGNAYTGSIGVRMGTGSGSFTFSAVSGAQVDSSPFPTNPYILLSGVGGHTGVTIIPSVQDTSRAFGMTLAPSVVAGQTYALNSQTHDQGILLAYSEGDGSEDDKIWHATSGNVVIVQRSASVLEVRLENVTFGGNADSAPGTFVVNGSFKK